MTALSFSFNLFFDFTHITHWRLNVGNLLILLGSLKFLGGRGDEGCRVGWEEKEKVSRWGIEEGKEEDKIREEGKILLRERRVKLF